MGGGANRDFAARTKRAAGLDRCRRRRTFGDSRQRHCYEIHDTGFKYNLSDVHSAIGIAQLRRVEELTQRRQAIAHAYNEAFANDPALQVPITEPGVEHAWHLYVMRLRTAALKVNRNQFVDLLRARGVGTSVHCIPLNTMDFYQTRYGYRTGDFPIAEKVYSRCFSLPIFPAMSDEDVAWVIESVRALAMKNRR